MPKKTTINQAKYDKEHIVRISLKLHKINDIDILEAIQKENSSSKQGAIKSLIRKAIKGDEPTTIAPLILPFIHCR